MPATPRTLELLRQTLNEKKRVLKEIKERQAASSAAFDSDLDPTGPSEPDLDVPESQQDLSRSHTKPDRSMPAFASPAGMDTRLPRVYKDFPQPENPEIVKIAIIGSPNVGKSTIVNALVRSTVSIASVRAHTTRERVRAVLTHENKQVVFYDTPGVVPGKNTSRMNRELVTASWKAVEDADHLLVVLDCLKQLDHSLLTESYIFERLGNLENKIPGTIIFNKLDLIKGREGELHKFVEKYKEQYPTINTVLYTSAETPMVGLKELRQHLLSLAQPGPWLYPAHQKTDQSDLSRVEDLIRSELYELLKVPYGVKQKNVGWTELEDGVLRIDQDLIVDRPGLKKIIVGSGGVVIRDLTMKTRQFIGKALRRKIMLNLQVKLRTKKA
ncbi:Era Like 12S Mitochondrial RRNA Chaperone 1 [Mortierella sp. NVP85]|nr:Era Like 12S Mitochondrial RRNA Chaperone 1 [Mortierella sp. NVP85]